MKISEITLLHKLERCYERLRLPKESTHKSAFEDFLKIILTKVYYEDLNDQDMVSVLTLNDSIFFQLEVLRAQCDDKLFCNMFFSQYSLICTDSNVVCQALRELQGFSFVELVGTNALRAFELFLMKILRSEGKGLFAPPSLVSFIMQLLEPYAFSLPTARLGDPTGGCGQFLSYYLKQGAHKMFSLGAVCDDPLMVVAIRINLYIQGIRDHVAEIKYRPNGLLLDGYYDIVASVIPDDRMELVREAVDSCSDYGRIGLIVNRKLIYDSSCSELMHFIKANTRIESITLVPENVFFNGSTVAQHCVLILKKEMYADSSEPYQIALSSVTDAGISPLGMVTQNLQLGRVIGDLKKWQLTRSLQPSKHTTFISSYELNKEYIEQKLSNIVTQYNNKYNIVRLRDVLIPTIGDYVNVEGKQTYYRLLIDDNDKPSLRTITDLDRQKGRWRYVFPGQFVIGSKGLNSFLHAVVPASRKKTVIPYHWRSFEILPGIISSTYLHYILEIKPVKRQLETLRTINRNPRIRIDQLLDITIPLPPIEVQEEMVSTLSLYDKRIERIKLQLQKAELEFNNQFDLGNED